MDVFHLTDLKNLAHSMGLQILGGMSITDAQRVLQNQATSLVEWQQSGYAGEMGYMKRPPELLCHPENLLPETESILTFLIPYSFEIPPEGPNPPKKHLYGRVARYAWGQDYHRVIRNYLERFVKEVARTSSDPSPIQYRVFSDSVPLLERSLGAAAGLGFIGKNSMLIRRGAGSYFFVAELLWNLKVDGVDSLSPVDSNRYLHPERTPGRECGKCIRCISECPTQAIVGSGRIDSRRCISYLTIEKRGILNTTESQSLNGWIFGCDICQEVCPFNAADLHPEPFDEFRAQYGVGPFLELKSILEMRTDAVFKERFSATALSRTGREGLSRNACSVAGNSLAFELSETIIHAMLDDPSPIIATQARDTLRVMQNHAEGLDKLRIQRALSDQPSSGLLAR